MGMIWRMDPAVIAAIVTTPTALLASTAAYAAGRHQARGAHRGPVDAVRRQHQRDAYAALLSALNSYAHATDWDQCVGRVRLARSEAGTASSADYHDGAVDHEAKQVRVLATRLLDPLRPALDVVSLEGPKHVADLAQKACWTAYAMGNASSTAAIMGPRWLPEPNDDPNQLHPRLVISIEEFTEAARDYLNG